MLGSIAIWMLVALPISSGQSSSCPAGETQFESRNFVSAQSLLWDCVLSGEADTNSALHLAWTYRELKNYESGLRKAGFTLQSQPNNENILYVAAYLQFRQGQQNKSLEFLAKAYRLKPDDWRIHQLFALNFIELNMTSYAEQEFLRAIKFNPTQPEIFYQLARLYYTQSRFQESIGLSKKALALAPEYSEVYDNLGLNYQAIQDTPRAIESYTKAIDLNLKREVPDEWPLINYGTFLSQSPERALPILQQALNINAVNPEANFQMGETLRRLGRDKEAETYFERSIAADPKFARAYYLLALLVRKEDPPRSAALIEQFKLLQDQGKKTGVTDLP